MKLFGEFLVEKGLLSEQQLLESVIEQLSVLPSVPEVLHKHGLLSHADLLKALKYQTKHKVDFVRACRILNVWTAQLESTVQQIVDEQREPIGQIFIKKGLLDSDQLTQALQDFFHNLAADQLKNGHDFKFEKSQPSFFDSLSATPLDESRFEIQILMAQLKEDSENRRLHASNLVKEMSCLKGIFRFIRAEASEKLIEKICTTIQVQSESTSEQSSWDNLWPVTDESFTVLWDLADKTSADGSEEAWWSENKSTYHRIYTSLDEITSRNQPGKTVPRAA